MDRTLHGHCAFASVQDVYELHVVALCVWRGGGVGGGQAELNAMHQRAKRDLKAKCFVCSPFYGRSVVGPCWEN
jgi:hypothetical protein